MRSLRPVFSPRDWSALATVFPAVLLLILGGIFLGRASMWWDESFTWISSIQPVSEIVKSATHNGDILFLPYYLFMHFWLEISQSLWWMRLPSLLLGAATVQALVLLARRWLSLAWSVLAGLLLALNPMFVEYSIAARPYTAATLLGVLSTIALVIALDTPTARRWILYGLTSLGLLLAHPLAAFVLVAQIIGVVVARRRSAWPGMALSLTCVAVLVSPFAAGDLGQGSGITWIPPTTLGTFHQALEDIAGGSQPAVPELGRITLAAILVICCIVLAAVVASSAPASEIALSSALCLAWSAVPPLLLVLVSFLHPLYASRYLLVCLPGVALTEAFAAWCAWSVLTERRKSKEGSGRGTRIRRPVWPVQRNIRQQRLVFLVAAATCGAICIALVALPLQASHVLQQRSFFSDDYRSAAAALSGDLLKSPASVSITPDWAAIGFSYYASPPALAQSLRRHATQVLDRETPNSSNSGILDWPVRTKPAVHTARCPFGWAVGKGIAPSRKLVVEGSTCQVTRVHSYGEVWVASVDG